MGKAVSYALKQWVYLERYVENGDYPIDNNRVERESRSVDTGRKAWLFYDTQRFIGWWTADNQKGGPMIWKGTLERLLHVLDLKPTS
ncbi:IS66 family transposase [Thaumasiovibrio sp. DFM-14]|uniref:IS66 family transposase n=1 Tax=Thaumasiovibrio sp. DFM-14 TaxID=3384792 RepID=UPI00399FC23E